MPPPLTIISGLITLLLGMKKRPKAEARSRYNTYAMAYIGDRLWRLRQERDLSQTQLAVKAKLSPRTIFQLENNRNKARHETIVKLAQALDVEPSDLIDEED
jgi:DNA-binding XRE family transcriptional regulator